uniref:PDZ domain-containing protein n=1 Tax=Macrostomum lignano TaxID=282301 RepID=A0A1I8IRK9_9PLAT
EEEEEAEQQDQVDSNDGDDNGGHVAEEDAGDDSPPPTPPPHQQQQQQLHHLEHHPAPYLFAAETLVDRCVVLEKSPGESLGMSVAGGVGSQRGDIPVYVTNLPPEGLAARSRQIRKGDIVLGVNEASLLGLQHEEAVSVLKSQPAGQVRIQLLQGPESSSGGGNFMPSWVYWLALPPFCYLEKATLPRSAHRFARFSIVGGCDSANGPQPIIVKSIVHGGPAHAHGQLRCGDLIIRVNGAYGLSGVTHSEAVSLLKQLPSEIIVLSVVSWPGTIV